MKTNKSAPFWNSSRRARRGARRSMLLGTAAVAALLLAPTGLGGSALHSPTALLTVLLAGAIMLGLRSLRAGPEAGAAPSRPALPEASHDGSHSRNESEYLLDYLYERAQRTNTPLALVVLEVEQFARLRAMFGAGRAAALLDELTSFAASHLPSDAVLVRWDQDSLALLLPATTVGQAGRLASMLAHAIAGHRFTDFGGIGCHMQVSDIGSQRHASALARQAQGLIGPAAALS